MTVRYNISENDGRRHGQGALTLWSSGANGGIQRALIHNNTIYMSAPADNSQPKALHINSEGLNDVGLHNNVLQTTGGLPVVVSLATRGVLLQGNAYWSGEQSLQIVWGAENHNSLVAWRAASGQEQLNARATGVEVNPQLQQPGTGGILATLSSGRQLTSLTAYQVQPNSGLVGAGLDLLREFNRDPGPHDFFENPTPAVGEKRTIGACETPRK
ncbi:hypothetical protein [Hymenobacter volaticus]|uniref:Mannuronan 5-epimerase n=1 Tax=Hymenobacter volaticus TaxID=2932254 RepID=A0ABY4GBJ1_9BACT|nr:hypothetical protein [Hymenobacter volaticus]UOQ68222.1 hypothetical protein MUN86_10435 [Hymenobacter volaticus]